MATDEISIFTIPDMPSVPDSGQNSRTETDAKSTSLRTPRSSRNLQRVPNHFQRLDILSSVSSYVVQRVQPDLPADGLLLQRGCSTNYSDWIYLRFIETDRFSRYFILRSAKKREPTYFLSHLPSRVYVPDYMDRLPIYFRRPKCFSTHRQHFGERWRSHLLPDHSDGSAFPKISLVEEIS